MSVRVKCDPSTSCLTHGKSQSANASLNARDRDHGVFDTTEFEPVVRIESQDKAEHVLEHEQARKCLDGNFTYRELVTIPGRCGKDVRTVRVNNV